MIQRLVLSLVCLLAGCDSTPPPLRVASLVWPGYESLYLARSMNYFSSNQVRLIELLSAQEVSNALRSKKVDAAMITLDEALVLMQEGVDLRVVLVMDASNGADVLLASADIKNLTQLKGRRIGLENAGNGALMLDAILNKAQLRPADVTQVHVLMAEQVKAYKNHEVDAVISYEPASTGLRKAGAKVLFDSREMPGQILDVLVVRADAMQASRANLSAAIKGHFAALAYLSESTQDAAVRMAPRLGVKPELVLQQFDGIKLSTLEENHRLLGGASPGIIPVAQSLADGMVAHHLLSKVVEVAHLSDSLYLPSIEYR